MPGQLEIEAKWQDRWRVSGNAREAPPTDQDSPGYYCLDMFPYPSLGGLSVNQLRGMLVTDVVARFQEIHGRAVLRPMGWDSFGLSIEQEALRRKKTPQDIVNEGVQVMRKQMDRLGLRIDWGHELSTSDPDFYRWTQWIFLRMYERGLAYRASTRMKWCPKCQMNLANEETQIGHCVHCGSSVVERDVSQWMLKITDFAERLHEGLKDLDWPARVTAMQRNWIGRRVGFKLTLKASHEFSGEYLEFPVFLRRLEAIPGATFVLLAPEHPLVETLCDPLYEEDVLAYRDRAVRKTERERRAADPTGQPTGAFAINPITLRAMPIWVSDFVLPAVRFGAILGVPEQDEKQARFAEAHRLPKIPVPSRAPTRRRGDRRRGAESRRHPHLQDRGDGRRNPFEDQLVGVSVLEARRRIRKILEARELLVPHVDYHLHDWVFSRQRYWGEPLPIWFDPDGVPHPVPDAELPVRVPLLDSIPVAEGGRSPLDQVPEFRDVVGPDGQHGWRREADTMPQWFGSCWYYLRYLSPKEPGRLFDPEQAKRWLPVDLCVGGIEHAILHLLYVRFVACFLRDEGLTHEETPFRRLFNQGRIYQKAPAEEVRLVPMHRGDRIEAAPFLEAHGADALRLHLLFLAPTEEDVLWSEAGLRGCRRFLERAHRVVLARRDKGRFVSRRALIEKHRLIRRVSRAIESFRLNKAVSAFMEFVKFLRSPDLSMEEVDRSTLKTFTILLSPFAPHMACELWEQLGNTDRVFDQQWPEFSAELLRPVEVEIGVQVENRLCDRLVVEATVPREELMARVLEREKVRAALQGRTPARWVMVPDRLVNILVAPPTSPPSSAHE